MEADWFWREVGFDRTDDGAFSGLVVLSDNDDDEDDDDGGGGGGDGDDADNTSRTDDSTCGSISSGAGDDNLPEQKQG